MSETIWVVEMEDGGICYFTTKDKAEAFMERYAIQWANECSLPYEETYTWCHLSSARIDLE